MTVQSPACIYTVLARFRGDRRRLVARRDGKEYLLIIVDSPPLARRLAPLFIDCRENGAFTDFIEFFPYEEGLCAVFRYQGARQMRPLGAVLSGAPPMIRAAALRSLFAFLLSQEIPEPILCDVLRPENLLCGPSGEVRFIYDLYFTPKYTRRDRMKAMLYLAEAVRTVCGGVQAPSVKVLCGLITGRPRGWTELYAAASLAAGELAAVRPETQPEKPVPRKRGQYRKIPGYARFGAYYISLPFLIAVAAFLLFLGLLYGFVLRPVLFDQWYAFWMDRKGGIS